MRSSTDRRGALRAGMVFAAVLARPEARACEYFAPNLRITHPWTRATPEGADFGVLSMKFDEVTQSDRLIGVETPMAERAELSGPEGVGAIDFAIPMGRESWLLETGTHVRLSRLTSALEVGRSYPLLLVFERGGAIQASLNVDYLRFR